MSRFPSAPPITVIDLFAGAGGLTQGLHAASERFDVLRAVEMDVSAAATYDANFPGKVFAGPIQEWLEQEEAPEADLVVGGPPCQGFSQLGLRQADDERNGLWRFFAETLKRSKPKYFVMENVPPFRKSSAFAEFSEMLADGSDSSGYVMEACDLDASLYGAPQRRKRIFVLGSRKDVVPLAAPPPWTAPQVTVREAFEAAGIHPVARKVQLPDRYVEFDGRELPGVFASEELHLSRDYRLLSLERFAHIPPGGNRFNLPRELDPARRWIPRRSSRAGGLTDWSHGNQD